MTSIPSEIKSKADSLCAQKKVQRVSFFLNASFEGKMRYNKVIDVQSDFCAGNKRKGADPNL